jgi:hypothetical protein
MDSFSFMTLRYALSGVEISAANAQGTPFFRGGVHDEKIDAATDMTALLMA